MSGTTYRDAGVDQERKDRFIDRVLELSKRTFGPAVVRNTWGFAGLYSLKEAHLLDGAPRSPVLVACADGVGTKIRVAIEMKKFRGLGIDLVAMNVNDLIVCGARPLFFLDYVAMGKVDPDVFLEVVEGMVDGCRQSGCALLGGETAEMPDMYSHGDFDIAGFAVGLVDRGRMLDGHGVEEGDDVIGVASSGVHSNGFSLVRRSLLQKYRAVDRAPGLKGTVGEELLKPTRIYVDAVQRVLRGYRVKKAVKALANITGGGMPGNIPRVIPRGLRVEIREGAWPVPPIFGLIEQSGVERREMYDVFNMGVGFVFVTAPRHTAPILRRLRGRRHKAWVIGRVEKGSGAPEVVIR